MKTKIITILLLFIFGLGAAVNAASVGTAFTYQGRLLDANLAADGMYDLQFKLYDGPDPEDAIQIGSTVSKEDVEVADGYFIADLDFGGSSFTGDARWLQIAVRSFDSIDPADYVALTPLQPLAPAPYALYASSAAIPIPLELSGASTMGIIFGTNSGGGSGIRGVTTSTTGRGVYGEATSTTGYAYGGAFRTYSVEGAGVHGFASASSGTNWGVYGLSWSTEGTGVYGYADSSTGTNYGVYGKTDSPDGYAGFFEGRVHVSGNLGAGVQQPKVKLDVSDTLRVQGLNYPSYPTTGEGLELAYNPASDTAVIQAVDRDAGGQFGKLYLGNGDVGIGTSSPARKLHVKDVMRLEPRSSAPLDPAEGDIYYSSTLHSLMVYNGTTWVACF